MEKLTVRDLLEQFGPDAEIHISAADVDDKYPFHRYTDIGIVEVIKEGNNAVICFDVKSNGDFEEDQPEEKVCKWQRAFDQNFNLGCVGKHGERGNGNFKGKQYGAKWEFEYCPYCGGKIELTELERLTGEDDE